MKIRTAVFPVAGLGTRFLPATKAAAKELFPLVDKPVLHRSIKDLERCKGCGPTRTMQAAKHEQLCSVPCLAACDKLVQHLSPAGGESSM